MDAEELGFVHRFVPAGGPESPCTLLLLHGAGGSETDLLEFGQGVQPNAALLSPRGKILENGQPRYFRRIAEGVFDIDDLQYRADELADFVEVAATAYKFDPHRVVAVGYSNGANIAATILLMRPATLAGAILLRPMLPLRPDPMPDLRGKAVLIEAGRTDMISPADRTAQLAAVLQLARPQVSVYWHETGHALTTLDGPIARDWLATGFSLATSPAGQRVPQSGR